jgi:NAD-dependent dihydropyrimidine dehydrogenase PreA subunit
MSASEVHVVLYEGAGSREMEPSERFGLMQALLEKGYPVSSIRSGMAADAVPDTVTLVLGRFAEPPKETNGGAVQARDIEGLEAAEVLRVVDETRESHGARSPGKWKPWFPVIDFQRCTNCMQCLSFCLFDVYGVSADGKIQVQNPSNCKTDCPACSRVCPEVAILFPKYRHGPIHGGEVNADDVRRESMKVDISALLGGDVYAALRDRSAKAKSRFSKERDEERALKERTNCLHKLQEQMDIPPEVIAALPTVEEIRAKAEAAKARAEAVLARRPETEV